VLFDEDLRSYVVALLQQVRYNPDRLLVDQRRKLMIGAVVYTGNNWLIIFRHRSP
jgi:hypothetical protein